VFFLISGFFLLSLPLSAQDSSIDPFYINQLEEGKFLYLSGDYSGSIESLQVASFGLLGAPAKRLECQVYLLLSHHALKDEEKAKFFRSEIKRLNLEQYLPSLNLPSAVKARYDQINAALARIEAHKAGQPAPAAAITPAPAAAPPAPAKSVAPKTTPQPESDPISAAQFAAQARAETRLSKKIALYDKALKADPRDITIYFELNDAYITGKKYGAAADLMETLALFYPDDIRIFIKLAENHLQDKAYEKAYRALVQAVKLDGGNLEVRYLLGKANMGLRRYKEAADELAIVLGRDPAFKDAAALNTQCLGKIK
jgi:cytochrome c-type biogenesis protein CcmH/NrfG